MKPRLSCLISVLFVATFSGSHALASSPAQEKEFRDKYQAAFEANDSADGKLVIPVPVPAK
jgi:hypothetical protein